MVDSLPDDTLPKGTQEYCTLYGVFFRGSDGKPFCITYNQKPDDTEGVFKILIPVPSALEAKVQPVLEEGTLN